MKLSYHNLNIEIPMEGIICIESIHIIQKLNEHGKLQIKALIEDEKAIELVEQTEDSLTVLVSENSGKRKNIFCGRAGQIYVEKEAGLYYLYMEFWGYTREWDRKLKSRSFCRENETYEQILAKVLSGYGNKEIRDEISGDTKIPGILLQYEETDWTFLKRLASHFSTFLAADNTQPFGKVYFGIPSLNYGAQLANEEYTLLWEKEGYERQQNAEGILKQELMKWRVRSRKVLQLCEQVMLNHVETVVTAVDIYTQSGEPVYEYELSRRKGLLTEKKKNPDIFGMSIPATVKERKGNQVRVHFDIDPSYEEADDVKFFTFAIETSNFYCMPEVGSRVHIYFPGHDENSAIAVHAISMGAEKARGGLMRSAGSSVTEEQSSSPSEASEKGTASRSESRTGAEGNASLLPTQGKKTGGASAAGIVSGAASTAARPSDGIQKGDGRQEKKQQEKDPAHKKFSDPGGSYMELEPGGITFSAGGAAILKLNQPGQLFLRAGTLSILAGANIMARVEKGGTDPEIYIRSRKRMDIEISGGSKLKLDEKADIKSNFIRMDAKEKKAAIPAALDVASQLMAWDAVLRNNYNAGAKAKLDGMAQKELELQKKERNGKSKIINGVLIIGGTLAGLAAIVYSGGTLAAVLVPGSVEFLSLGGVTVGAAATVDGIADIKEGMGDIKRAKNGDLSRSPNMVRDSLFKGNEAQYQNFKFINNLTFQMVTGPATAASQVKLAAKFSSLFSGFKNPDTVRNVVGYGWNIGGTLIEGGYESYQKKGEVTAEDLFTNAVFGLIKGYGTNALYTGGTTGDILNDLKKIGVSVGGGTGFGMLMDYEKNKITESPYIWQESLLENLNANSQAFMVGDPILMENGTFVMTAADLVFPDVAGQIHISRRYFSTDKRSGWMGMGWHFLWESKLCRDGEILHIRLPDGCSAAFIQENGKYRNYNGNGRYTLFFDRTEGKWLIGDLHTHKTYCCDEEGLLTSVTDQNGLAVTLSWREGYPCRLQTPLGGSVVFRFREGKLVQLEDNAGRKIEYRYENGLLSDVVQMDGGITHYEYSTDGYLIRPVDLNGVCYLENRYDGDGRVISQRQENGDIYTLETDLQQKRTWVEYSAYPGRIQYVYDDFHRIVQILHPDGSEERFDYDAGHNRILEVGRLGECVEKAYDNAGHLIKESRPEGLVKEYVYDEAGDLTAVLDNGGRESLFTYDARHNLTVRQEKVAEDVWKRQEYSWDRMGRLITEKDGEGHLTRYCYEELSAYPSVIVYDDGSEQHFEYDGLGRCMAREDETGRTEYGYNRGGHRTMVRDGEGNEAHWLYDGMGRRMAGYSPRQWKDRSMGHTAYQYDFLNNLTDTIYPDGSHEKLFRDGMGNITKKVHPNAYDEKEKDGEGICYDYDGEGHLLRVHYSDGGVERFFYDASGNRIRHVLPEQYQEETDDGDGFSYTYDRESRLLTVTGPDGCLQASYAYDLWGNCICRKDANGGETRFTYDLTGQPVKKLEAVGAAEEKEDRRYRQTLYEYDACGNKIREIRCGGSYRADGTGKTTGTDLVLAFTYDARNRLVKAEDVQGAKILYRYDERGNRVLEEQTICNGDELQNRKEVLRRLRYSYDRASRLIKKTELIDSGLTEDAGKPAALAVTLYTRDADGNITEIMTPEGYRISRSYDVRDRLVSERVEDKENGIDRTAYFSYDRAGNLICVRQEGADGKLRRIDYDYDLKDRLTRLEELDGPVVEADYDRNDRLASRKNLLPAEEERIRKVLYHYDSLGNLTERRKQNGTLLEENRYDRAGNLVDTKDGDGIGAAYRYGLQGEQREIITAESRKQSRPVQRLTYNARGQITGIEDGNGGKTAYDLDHWGRITALVNPEGSRETYSYDHAGNITETRDARGGTIRYDYNSLGKVCAIIDQKGNRETFRYDREGRRIEHTDRNGALTRTFYNVDGAPTLQVCTDKAGNRQIMGTWEYDSLGHLKKSVAGGFCYTYEYRADGKLLKKYSSGRPILSCTYFKDGSLKSLTDVTGKTTRYAYDEEGRLASLKDGEGDVLTEYRYTTAGRLKEIRTSSGINAAYEYDKEGNLSRLTLNSGDQGNFLYDTCFTYDLNGNRLSRMGERLGAEGRKQKLATRYLYDLMNRLTEENRNGEGEKYAYDITGNRIRKEHFTNRVIDAVETYCYNERNELTEWNQAGKNHLCQYDLNGNLLKEKAGGAESEYRYDLLNRQSYVRTPEGSIQENRYDGEGLRAGITENGKEAVFHFHNRDILAESDGEGRTVKRHLTGLGLSCIQTLDDERYHDIHQDEQGSTVYVTGQTGTVENSYLYDAFGNLLESREIIPNRMLYTGQQYDQAAGQYYLRARYYNPVIGRFTQEDNYRGDGLNLYVYCGNNPVMYYDPEGHLRDEFIYKNPERTMAEKATVSIEGGSGAPGNRNRIGETVPPTEKTLDMALDPETYANEIAKKYGINLKGSGQDITIKYNPDLRPGVYGRTLGSNPNVIEIGPDALMSESELANTIAHELNHARDFIKGGFAPEPPAYDSGNALADYINGGR